MQSARDRLRLDAFKDALTSKPVGKELSDVLRICGHPSRRHFSTAPVKMSRTTPVCGRLNFPTFMKRRNRLFLIS